MTTAPDRMTSDLPAFPTMDSARARLVQLQRTREDNATIVGWLRIYRGPRHLQCEALQLAGRIIFHDTSLMAAIDLELDMLNDIRNPAFPSGEVGCLYVDAYLKAMAITSEAAEIDRDIIRWHSAAFPNVRPLYDDATRTV